MSNTRQKQKSEDTDQLHLAIKAAVNKFCSSDVFITQLSNSIFETIRDKFEADFKLLENKNLELEKRIQKQEDDIKLLSLNNEKYEKWLRRNNIMVFGLEEKNSVNPTDEILKVFNTKMNLQIEKSSIESCYRLGKPNEDKPRPLLVKFASSYVKQVVYLQKKLLKGTRYIIKEDLTKDQLNLISMAVQKVGDKRKVWTSFGDIFVKSVAENKLIKIFSIDDLAKILNHN